ncbi:hypothetical protein Scep_004281 [Stephania cephalantha]|uniref:Uncharacterized protein n=1 Tax=Stephania cephalantha TaxID=152367 RepID=A0AAP0KS65_9MAGN
MRELMEFQAKLMAMLMVQMGPPVHHPEARLAVGLSGEMECTVEFVAKKYSKWSIYMH